MISGLIDTDGDFRKNMAHICILNCYVKRRANLSLLKDRRQLNSSEELYLSLKESSEYIRLYGGVSDVYSAEHKKLDADLMLLCFDLWQGVLEELLPELYAVTAKISFDDGFSFRITADTNKELNILHRFYDIAHKLGCRLTQTSEDDTVYVTLRVKGGDAV